MYSLKCVYEHALTCAQVRPSACFSAYPWAVSAALSIHLWIKHTELCPYAVGLYFYQTELLTFLREAINRKMTL